jgi:hypothetical protein
MIDLLHHALDALLERNLRPPAQTLRDLPNVSEGAVRFARTLRQVNHIAAEKLDEAVDGLRRARADVEAFPDLVGFGRGKKAFATSVT